jgi:hypothetical protein
MAAESAQADVRIFAQKKLASGLRKGQKSPRHERE